VTGSAKRVSDAWTDDGTSIDHRQLKHRARDAVRVMPIPPVSRQRSSTAAPSAGHCTAKGAGIRARPIPRQKMNWRDFRDCRSTRHRSRA
jgi:hypothetical protein